MVKSFVISGALFRTECPTPFAVSAHVFRFGDRPFAELGLSAASGIGQRRKLSDLNETGPICFVETHNEQMDEIALLAHSLYVLHGCEEGHEEDYRRQATAFWHKQQSEPLINASRPRGR